MQKRTPSKVRSRRESFRPDEIPTRDTPPSTNQRQHSSEPSTPTRPSNESATLFRHRGGSTATLNDTRKRTTPKSNGISQSNIRRSISMDFTSNSKDTHQRRHSENNRLIWKSLIQHPMIDDLSEIRPDDDDDDDDSLTDDNQRETDNNNQDGKEESAETPDTESTKAEGSESVIDAKSASDINMAPGQTFMAGQALSMSDFDSSDPRTLNLSKCIYKMWRNKQLCDVVFFVEEEKEQFYAHKLVLATTCDLFVEKSGELGLVEIHLPRVRAVNMQRIVKFFYTDQIEITMENVEDALEISKQLHSKKLLNHCKDYLLDVTMATSVRNRIIALTYALHDVVTSIDSYIQQHFTSLINSDTFLKSDFRIIHEIISSDMLTTPDELQIFQACAMWINFDPDERVCYAIPLMSMVRFHHISPANIVSHVEQVSFMAAIPECKDMLYKAFRHHALFRDLIKTVSRPTPRSPISGRTAPRSTPCYRSPGSTSPDNMGGLQSLSSDTDNKQKQDQSGANFVTCRTNTSKSPPKRTFRDAMNKIQNALRLRGPEIQDSTFKPMKRPEITLPSATKIQALDKIPSETRNKSERRKSMHIPAGSVKVLPPPEDSVSRPKHMSSLDVIDGAKNSQKGLHKTRSTPLPTRFDIGEQNGLSPILAGSEPLNPACPPMIFVVGGINPYHKDHDAEKINISQSIQQFNVNSNTWTVVSKLPKSLHHLSATMAGDQLFVTGGFRFCQENEEMPSRDCFTYSVISSKWSKMRSLKSSRARHVCVTVDDVVYVIGGIDCLRMGLKSMEYYDKEEGDWLFTQPMKDPRFDLAAVPHGGQIFVVGGRSDVGEKRLLNTVEVFDLSSGRWKSKSRFPLHIAGGSLVEVKDSVYFVGGFVFQDNASLSIDSIFRYCDDTDSWEAFQTLRVPRHGALVTAIGCRIYVIGGESSASLGHALTNVECIDVETNDHVTGIAPLLSPAFGVGGCSWKREQF